MLISMPLCRRLYSNTSRLQLTSDPDCYGFKATPGALLQPPGIRTSQLWACTQMPFLLCMPLQEHSLYSYSAAEAHALLHSVLKLEAYAGHGTRFERGLRLVMVPVPADADIQLLEPPAPEELDLELGDTSFAGELLSCCRNCRDTSSKTCLMHPLYACAPLRDGSLC